MTPRVISCNRLLKTVYTEFEAPQKSDDETQWFGNPFLAIGPKSRQLVKIVKKKLKNAWGWPLHPIAVCLI